MFEECVNYLLNSAGIRIHSFKTRRRKQVFVQGISHGVIISQHIYFL